MSPLRLQRLPNSRLSPVARWIFQPGASFNRLIPHATKAATINRNRAIATANGLMSTPQTPSSAFWAATISLFSRFIQRWNSRANPPSRKCPEPHVGSIIRTVSSPNSSMAGFERAVEDELLDEHGRLQQGVLLLRLLGEFLIQVTQEPCVAALDLERPLEVPCLGLHLPPERQELHRRIARWGNRPERRLALGEQVFCSRDLADLVEDVLEVLPVGLVGMLAEEEFVRVLGQPAAARPHPPASTRRSGGCLP